MTKKEYLIKALNKLKWYWPKADEILLKLQEAPNNEYIEYWYERISKTIDEVQSETDKNNQINIQDYVKKLKKLEEESIVSDQKDLENLENLMSNM